MTNSFQNTHKCQKVPNRQLIYVRSMTNNLINNKIKKNFKPNELAQMGGFLLSKAEVPGSSLLGHLPKEFSLRLT